MERKDVDVTYDLNTDTWTITPELVPMKEAGVIVFHRVPSDAPWTFQHINGVPGSWKQHAVNSGETYELHDPHGGVAASYKYTVTVHGDDDDEDHEGPNEKNILTDPPIIINEL